MALTINHQTNDISATSGSVTIDGVAAGATVRAWASKFNDSGIEGDDFNVSSYTDLGTDVGVTFSASFATAGYAVVCNADRASFAGTIARFGMSADHTTSGFIAACWSTAGATSTVAMSFSAHGSMA